MNMERMQLKGLLVESQRKYKTLDTEASGLIVLIRSALSPYQEDMTKLEIDKVKTYINRLNFIILDLKELKSKIEKLEREFEWKVPIL